MQSITRRHSDRLATDAVGCGRTADELALEPPQTAMKGPQEQRGRSKRHAADPRSAIAFPTTLESVGNDVLVIEF
jgi:hypothetical protein